MNEEFSATIIDIPYTSPDRDYIIAKAECAEGMRHTVKGNVPADDVPSPMMPYLFFGRWQESEYRGRPQKFFGFSSCTPTQPIGERGTIEYLKAADGIGPATAMKLWEAFGQNVLEEIRTADEEVFADLFGEVPRWLEAASHMFNVKKGDEKMMVALAGLIDGRGFPKSTKLWCKDQWGEDAPRVITDNPFELLKKAGIGFARCDQFWFSLGKSPDEPKRQMHCAVHAVALCPGDSWVRDTVVPRFLDDKIIGADPVKSVQDAINTGWLADEYTDQDESFDWDGNIRWLAEAAEAKAEKELALSVAKAVDDPVSIEIPKGTLSDHQYEKIAPLMATPSAVKILTGLAGTGKTYCIAAIVKHLLKTIGPNDIALTAFTGKATQQIEIAMRDSGLDLSGQTSHSLLGYTPKGWTYGKDRPLEQKVVIIDEFSMDDTKLSNQIFAARGRGTMYLITGDIAQLLPIGRGKPLRDMIESGVVPHAHLTEVHRTGGSLLEQCNALRSGSKVNFLCGGNLEFIQQADPARVLEDTVARAEELGIDDTMVITPTNKGELGRPNLNKLLQNRCNKNEEIEGIVFRIGDRVINRQNGWIKCTEAAHGVRLQLGRNMILADAGVTYAGARCQSANGDMGEVIDWDNGKMTIALSSPYRVVEIRVGKQDKKHDDDRDSYIKHQEVITTGCSFELAWSISGHLSQGGQWKNVINVIDPSPGAKRLCGRNWLYTAMTRTQSHLVMIGSEEVAQFMASNTNGSVRKTFLKERLQNLLLINGAT